MKATDITVEQHARLLEIKESTDDAIEQLASAVCFLFKLSYRYVNSMPSLLFKWYLWRIKFISEEAPKVEPLKEINYDVSKYKWRQYIEIAHFSKSDRENNISNLVASIIGNKDSHKLDATRVLKMPYYECVETINLVIGNIDKLNKKFEPINEEDEETEEVIENIEERNIENEKQDLETGFAERWGWLHSTAMIAEHYKVTLESAYEFTVLQCLNTLQYLKDLSEYNEQINKNAIKASKVNA